MLKMWQEIIIKEYKMKKSIESNKAIKILAFSGWTQDKLADLVDVSNVIVNKWARCKAQPKGDRSRGGVLVFTLDY